MRKVDKIYLISTGLQAPHGIGEIMTIIPLAHKRKIIKYLDRYYNAPEMRLNSAEGRRMDFDFDGDII